MAENLIFKGGTCLRIFFDLPRLSEDLDFDWSGSSRFDTNGLALSIRNYFAATFKFNALEIEAPRVNPRNLRPRSFGAKIRRPASPKQQRGESEFASLHPRVKDPWVSRRRTKIAGNYHTLYVKFPVLDLIGLPLTPSDSKILFVRLDITPAVGSSFTTEPAIKSTRDFSFVLKRYSLPDLMAGKIAAILTRDNARNYYDLIWFLEKGVIPNWQYLRQLTGLTKTKALDNIKTKITKIDYRYLQTELSPYFSSPAFVRSFSRNILSLYNQYLPVLMNA